MAHPASRDTGERILGTRIHALDLGDEPVLLISDLHLRPEEDRKLAALDRFLAALPQDSRLVVLGDLFDYWVGYKQGRIAAWSAILDRFAALQARGIRSYYLWGNRDYQLDSHFAHQVGGEVIPGGLRLRRPSGPTLLCLHGDELCLNDSSYQAAKRRLRSWPVRFLAHHLPISIGQKAAGKARSKSREVISGTDQVDLQPSQRALQAVHAAGTESLLFGHIHVAGSGSLVPSAESCRYSVLPAFEACWPGSARFDTAGRLELLRDGEPCPWPGPISLSP
jgi:UDP-2,3-diacylglucosamine hydrolase